jgi:hypothetical protein
MEFINKHIYDNLTSRRNDNSELIVAEIEDEALLGLDILMKGKGGPADIKLTEGLILLDGIAIPCTQIGQPEPVRKITARLTIYTGQSTRPFKSWLLGIWNLSEQFC